MRKWTIGAKVGAQLLAVLVQALCVCCFGLWIMMRTSHQLDVVGSQYLLMNQAAGEVERELLNARIHFIYFVTVQKKGSLEKGWPRFRNAEAAYSKLGQVVKQSDALAGARPEVEQLGRDIDAYKPVLERIIAVVQQKHNQGPEFDALLNEWARLGGAMVDSAGRLSRGAYQRADESAAQAAARLQDAGWILAATCSIPLLTGLILPFFVRRQITGVLQELAVKMAEGAEQVATAAAQVASSSQSLAQNASKQAASIEETAASIHEITTVNQENAGRANGLVETMKEVGAASRIKDSHMDELVAWVEATHESGRKVAKIIKAIDEIAFQTNILALNAAVEAARAGEAGSGFAVVADEVRNLAGRSAEAARNTAQLIEEAIRGSEQGKQTANRCQEAGATTTRLGREVAQLSTDVCHATSEQAKGIQQIEQALVQIGTATQATAASAKQSAAASEELDAQAAGMRQLADQLSELVQGR